MVCRRLPHTGCRMLKLLFKLMARSLLSNFISH
jgi:hypothetical protein